MSPQVIRLETAPTHPMVAYSAQREGKIIGTIAIATRDHMNAATVLSLLMADMRFATEKGEVVAHSITQGSVLTMQRNDLVNRLRGDWLLFIDDDMTFPPDAIARLVATREEHDLDMVGGLCFRRSAPYQPTLYMREQADSGRYNIRETWTPGEIVEVDATGMAFCLIHQRVFEMIAGGPMPSFEERMAMGGPPPNFFTWDGIMGEDLRFCQQAKAAGVRIFVDTGIEIGHISEVTIGHRDFLAQLASRTKAEYEERLQVNDAMGLPTMSPAEARERLGWK